MLKERGRVQSLEHRARRYVAIMLGSHVPLGYYCNLVSDTHARQPLSAKSFQLTTERCIGSTVREMIDPFACREQQFGGHFSLQPLGKFPTLFIYRVDGRPHKRARS